MQSLVAAVTSFGFQAGELAFLLSGRGSSFLRRAFSFCLNRCLRRSGRKRAVSEAGRLALCAFGVVMRRLALTDIGSPSGLVEAG